MRTSASLATFTWTNVFGAGGNLVLTVTAARVGTVASLAAGNLTYTTGTVSGQSGGGLRLSLDTSGASVGGTGEDVAFAFTYQGSPITVTNLSFMISDIDGDYHSTGSAMWGAELVSITQGVGAIVDPAYVTGAGTSADPWRRKNPSLPDLVGLATSATTGSILVTNAGTSGFTIGFRINFGSAANDNIWVTPLSFTVANPACP